MSFSVKVENTEKNVRRLTITVPKDLVDREFGRVFAETQQKAKIKGFRPGQAPVSIIRQFYFSDIMHEVSSALIEKSYAWAVGEQGLRVVSRPKIEAPTEQKSDGASTEHHHHAHPHATEGQPMTYTALVEVFPEFEIKNYKGLSLKREKIKVDKDEVEKVITNLRESRAQLVPSEKSEVQKGDFADMEFDGKVVKSDGTLEALPGMKGAQVVEVGSGSLIPGFEDHLIGMKAGDSKTFRIKFPEDYSEAKLAAAEAEFSVKVNGMKTKQLPGLDDDFAKELNYTTVAELRSKTEENITKYKNDEADDKLRNDALQTLIEKNKFEVPGSMIMAQARMIAEDYMKTLKDRGVPQEKAQELLMSEQEQIKTRAENQVRAGLILDAIAKTENVTVGEAEVEDEVRKMAESNGLEFSRLRKMYLDDPDRRENLEFRIKENRTLKLILDSATIKNV